MTIIENIIKVAKVSESDAKDLLTIIEQNFDLDHSEATQKEINSTIREAIRFKNMKCSHLAGTQHSWECIA